MDRQQAIRMLKLQIIRELSGQTISNSVLQNYIIEALEEAIASLAAPSGLAKHPLTLDELESMDGQPVWIVTDECDHGEWGIMRVTQIGKTTYYHVAGTVENFSGAPKEYGRTWLVYGRSSIDTQKIPAAQENPPQTAPDTVKPERKSKRVNLLIRPSVLDSLTKIARMRQTSVNDLLNTLAENLIAEEAETLTRYDETFFVGGVENV